ncbi:MAG: tRNA uridine-5-carboxymethylaminomethyl(34) synthesis GTPase MnmE [Bacillota bacterium]|nr:tRNA uridine-5-carboxymethylaminomethyl(34) synthesis GTPase MnmE [Bacillota bacterium]
MATDLLHDTIAAIATPSGTGGIGIIRISGGRAAEILSRLIAPHRPPEAWRPRHLYTGELRAADGAAVDQVLAVVFAAPHSYTAEQAAEIHCHGGARVLREALRLALEQGARLAEPGEFTLRAFLNGRIDLTQAEAVADIINAAGGTAQRMAARQLGGGLAARLSELEDKLLQILAAVTVAVDYPDDADAPAPDELAAAIDELLGGVETLLERADSGRIYREGVSAALIGAVNAGKSSLMNRLLGEERAIVTAEAGTTRDLIEERLDIDGLSISLSDTAGLREAEALSAAERLGIERSRRSLRSSQIVLAVFDAARPCCAADEPLLAELGKLPSLALLNKADIAERAVIQRWQRRLLAELPPERVIVVSAKSGAGVERLRAAMRELALGGDAAQAAPPWLGNSRHIEALYRCREHLRQARAAAGGALGVDMAGVDLENAWQALGEISGKTASDEVISAIFANFCVGK